MNTTSPVKPDQLCDDDLPLDATYTRGVDGLYAYVNGVPIWDSFSKIGISRTELVARVGGERVITRAEAIAILKHRGQWREKVGDGKTATTNQLLPDCQSIERELRLIYDELESRYDGAPDSTTLWMGSHIDGIRAALIRKPVNPTPSTPHGGPHDDAADAWAKERGYRVVGWRSPNNGETIIGCCYQSNDQPAIPPHQWSDHATKVVGNWDSLSYIVEPLPKDEAKGDENCECFSWATDDVQAGLLGNGHHHRCEHFKPSVNAVKLLGKLVDGIDTWASQEDGVPDWLWDAYSEAHMIARGLLPKGGDESSTPVKAEPSTSEVKHEWKVGDEVLNIHRNKCKIIAIDGSHFWLRSDEGNWVECDPFLSRVPPTLVRFSGTVSYGIKDSAGRGPWFLEVPLISRDGVVELDRERVALEWLRQKFVDDESQAVMWNKNTLDARLAEIKKGGQ